MSVVQIWEILLFKEHLYSLAQQNPQRKKLYGEQYRDWVGDNDVRKMHPHQLFDLLRTLLPDTFKEWDQIEAVKPALTTNLQLERLWSCLSTSLSNPPKGPLLDLWNKYRKSSWH